MNFDSIRTRFDAILRDNIRRLLDSMPEAASLPFDIVTITSLILLVEKEKEIEASPDAVDDRYSEDSLLEDLAATGLNIDENSRDSIRNLQSMGFVEIGTERRLAPRESTSKLVAVLDNLFPGMPGMNLVAYFLQTMNEAASGRKEIEQAIRQFEQTLISRGIPLSKSNQPREKTTGTANGVKAAEKIDYSRRISHLERLRRIRSTQNSQSADASSVRSLTGFQKVEVVSLFPTSASSSEACEPGAPAPHAQQHGLEADRTAGPQEISDPNAIQSATSIESGEIPQAHGSEFPVAGPDAGTLPAATACDPAGAESADPTDCPGEAIPQGLLPDVYTGDAMPIEADPEPIETIEKGLIQNTGLGADSKADPEVDSAADSEADSEADPDADRIAKEEIVDLQVQQFQQTLAMTCPLCRTGIIQPSKTDKGKIYYSCENRDCNFISWGKPYHFVCPYCRNPFLVEYTDREGVDGLKCPKATCNYRQEHLNSPAAAVEPAVSLAPAVAENSSKKGKILVKRRLVRRKR